MKSIAKILIAISMVIFTGLRTNAQISVGLSVRIAPPALPVYEQPMVPGEGYIWVPGYWAYADEGYYWVPGVWVRPPHYGLLWTPGYWGFNNGYYGWHAGYWGPHVGFYGGINYGFGYGGVGYGGGMWRGNVFAYNTAVTRVNTTVVHNTYVNRTVINNTTIINNHNSYNGPGGVTARPNQQEQQALREQHVQPTRDQLTHETSARSDRNQFASVNHGHPSRLAVNAVNTNRVDNAQNHVASNNSSNRNVPANQAIQNNDDHNANRELPANAQMQHNAPNPNSAVIRNEQMNDVNERRQNRINQGQMRNNQMNNAPRQQMRPHAGNAERGNGRGNRH